MLLDEFDVRLEALSHRLDLTLECLDAAAEDTDGEK